MVKKLIIFLIIVGVAALGAEISSVFLQHVSFNFKTFLMRFPAAAVGYVGGTVIVSFTQYKQNPFLVYLLPSILAFVCAETVFFLK